MLSDLSFEPYETEIRELVKRHASAEEIFESILVLEAQRIADTGGFVRVPVPAVYADLDTTKTIEAAARLEQKIARPNASIELVATEQGIDAFELCLIEGISASISLITSGALYRRVVEAYIGAIEHRLNRQLDVRSLISIADVHAAPPAANVIAALVTDLQIRMFSTKEWLDLAALGAKPLSLVISTPCAEDVEQLDLMSAHRAIAELEDRGVSIEAHAAKVFRGAFEERRALEEKLFLELEARRRSADESAPQVPDQRNIADLGTHTFGAPEGYDRDLA